MSKKKYLKRICAFCLAGLLSSSLCLQGQNGGVWADSGLAEFTDTAVIEADSTGDLFGDGSSAVSEPVQMETSADTAAEGEKIFIDEPVEIVPDETPETSVEEPASEEVVKAAIILTADDVVLRSQPSVESEPIDLASLGTELELLDQVESEGAVWYKVNYQNAEAYIRSDLAEIIKTDAEPQPEEEPEADVDAESEEEPEADADAENEEEPEADVDADVENEEEPEADADADVENEKEAEADADADVENEKEAEADADAEIEKEPEADADVEIEEEPKAEADVGNEKEPEVEADAEIEEKSEADADVENEEEPEADANAETEEEPKAEADVENEKEPEADADAEIEEKSEADADAETEEESENGDDSETPTDTEAETATIVITADGVILRAEPSVEAEVIDVVNAGTELELLNEVETEDAVWYKVHYDTEETSEDDAAEDSQDTDNQQDQAELELLENAEPEEVSDTLDDETPSVIEAYVRSDQTDVEIDIVPEDETNQVIYEQSCRVDDVIITVSAVDENAIPTDAILRVTPITKSSDALQYADVETYLLEKAENEEYEIAGFLAYDIYFEDAEENRIEPDGRVRVTMVYDGAEIPAEALETANDIVEASEENITIADVLDVTVMHLEENDGQVEQVVNMEESGQLENLETTANQEIEKAEFVTDSFSKFTITWTRNNGNDWPGYNSITATITVYYVDENGNEIGDFSVADVSSKTNTSIDLTSSDYKKDIEGYALKKIVVDNYNGTTEITKIQYKNSKNQYSIQYLLNGSWKDWLDFSRTTSGDIYFVYELDGIIGTSSSTVVVDNTVTLRAGNVTGIEELEDFKEYFWSSNNTSIATVSVTDDNEPIATGISEGTTTIIGTKEENDSITTIKWEIVVKSKETGSITFSYTNGNKIMDAGEISTESGNDKSYIRYSVMLVDGEDVYFVDFDTDGTAKAYKYSGTSTLTYDAEMTKVIAGARVADKYTYNTEQVYMNPSTISYMGISIPGYTFEEGWAFFCWSDYWCINGTRVNSILNYGAPADNGKSSWTNSYLGYDVTKYLTNIYTGEGYSPYNGSDYKNAENFFAYNPTGTIRFVFNRVSEKNAYHVNYTDAFDQVSPTLFKQDEMNMIWEEGTISYYGMIDQELYDTNEEQYPLYTPTEEQLALHPGYVFDGWYKSIDDKDYNNGTGDLATDDLNDHFNTDVTYYAKWRKDTNRFTVSKKGDDGEGGTVVLAGAKFTLKSKADDGSFKEVDASLVTNNKGEFTFDKFENFTVYELTESYPPSGYEKRNSFYFCIMYDVEDPDSKTLKFYITDKEGVPLSEEEMAKEADWLSVDYVASGKKINVIITIVDELIKREVTVVKQDKDGNGLEGAVFDLYKKSGETYVKVENFSGMTSTTVDNLAGFVFKEELSYGEYKLVETSAPGYYKCAEVEFTLNDPDKDGSGLVIDSAKNGSATSDCVTNSEFVEGEKVTTYSYTVTVKNTAVNWRIIKRSLSDENSRLMGAEFTLTDTKDSSKVYTGISGSDGEVTGLEDVPDGEYILKEIKAPVGYSLGDSWKITIQSGYPTIEGYGAGQEQNNKLIFYYDDVALYSLPSTGGRGIYWYSIGGMLLMMAAALIVYKNKCKEVLKN